MQRNKLTWGPNILPPIRTNLSKEEDEGLHVFAACIYALMKEEHYNTRGEVFETFLTRMVQSKLKPGLLEQVYTTFMGH